MKTTSQKLLTSLLALGLTSSTGLYAQNSSTIPAENNIPFVFGAQGNDFIQGVNFYSPVNEDLDADNNFDIGEDANNNGILDAGLNEFQDQVDYDGDGVIDATDAIAQQNLFNEDLDGDGNFDRGIEDANGNGVFDNGLNRSYIEAVNPITGARQDLDILVENGLFVNGEMVATENYVDAADARLQGQIDQNRSAIRKNSEDIETNTRGIAMVAALQHTTVLPGMTNAFDLSAAYFEGETGMALNYARRINDNVQINFGAASTTDFEESVIKAGIGVQW